MPEGSSSEAPVTRPGPRMPSQRFSGGGGYVGSGAASRLLRRGARFFRRDDMARLPRSQRPEANHAPRRRIASIVQRYAGGPFVADAAVGVGRSRISVM